MLKIFPILFGIFLLLNFAYGTINQSSDVINSTIQTNTSQLDDYYDHYDYYVSNAYKHHMSEHFLCILMISFYRIFF